MTQSITSKSASEILNEFEDEYNTRTAFLYADAVTLIETIDKGKEILTGTLRSSLSSLIGHAIEQLCYLGVYGKTTDAECKTINNEETSLALLLTQTSMVDRRGRAISECIAVLQGIQKEIVVY